ncbi:MAG: 2-hydroxyacyl-CoA dehydratase [Deltaproteobacteria bacterium]|nr:2-hydroxyacyl-CoA dehydratase [Candidatus Zymogenaceae bacterium]
MDAAEVLQEIRRIVEDPVTAGKRFKDTLQKPIIGYFCTYTPEEMIHAAGCVPYRIMGRKKQVEFADRHLQSYSCSLVRTALDTALSGDLSFIDGTVFPHTCDSIQRLSDIWRINAGFSYHADIVLPVKLHTESARTYVIEELSAFRASLEEFVDGEITDDSLWDSIRMYNRMRDNLNRLHDIKRKHPGIVGSKITDDCVQAAMYMPVQEHNRLIEELLSELEGKEDPYDPIRVVVVGNMCVFTDIYDCIENAGASVSGDDICTGSRYYSLNVDVKKKDPIEALADRIIQRPLCAAKHSLDFDRGMYLKSIIDNANAKGVIFLLIKFCDPHSFDYPHLKNAVEEKGLPHMLIEMEMDNPSPGQIRTRIEAFIEMLAQG